MKLFKHHIIPRCLDGSDDPSNIKMLTYDEHVEAHRILCEKYPNHFGLRFAYLNMMNLSEQAHKEACSLGGKNSVKSGGPSLAGKVGGKTAGKITGTKNLRLWSKNNPEVVSTHARNLGIKYSKRIICVETGKIYDSVNQAMRDTQSSNISRALKSGLKASGLTWKYYE